MKQLTINTCPVCGQHLSEQERGRPKQYCSKECRDLNNYMIATRNALMKVNFRPKKKSEMIGEIFRMANEFRNHA